MMPETAEPTLAWSARTLCCSWISATMSVERMSEKRRMLPGRLVAEERDQNRETKQDGELEKHLAAVAEKDPPAAREQGGELAEKTRQAQGFRSVAGGGGLRVGSSASAAGFGGGGHVQAAAGDEALAVALEHLLVGLAVFLPRGVPALGRLRGEPRIDLLGVVHGKIMGQLLRRPVKRDAALVQHEDGIVELQMRQRVGHREHDAAVLARKIVQQADDFPLRARIEAGGHLVAEQDLRIGNQLHRQPEPAFLAAGKHLHLAVADRVEAGFLQHAVDALVEFRGVARADAQAGGGLHATRPR